MYREIVQRVVTSVILAMLVGQATGGTVEWVDTFDNPGTDGIWYGESGVWDEGIPTSGPNAPYMGVNCGGTVLGGNYPVTADSRFIRFSSFLVPANNPRLRFWHWYSFSTSDRGYVEVQIAGSGIWEKLSPDYTSTGSGVYTHPLIDLSDYAGEIIQVAFHFIALNGNAYNPDESSGWYIDDVSLESGDSFFNNPEDFESGMGDWHSERGTWEVGVISGTPSASNGVATVIGGNYATTVDSKLVSPSFFVPVGKENPRLRFWHKYSFSTSDKGYVEVEEVGGGTWTKVSPNYTSTSSSVYTRPTIDLSNYAGKTIRVAFHFIAADGNAYNPDESSGWYIDDVSLETGPLVFRNPEGFEDGAGDWYVTRGTWQVGAPSSGPGSAYSGINCAATRLNNKYAETVNSQLISPWFAVPDSGVSLLRFRHWYSFSTSDKGYVEIQTIDGSTFDAISPDYVATSGGWSQPLFDLSDYAGDVVRIAFHFIAANGNAYNPDESSGWYIDEISLPQYAGVHFDDILTRTTIGTNLCVTGYSSPGSTNLEFTITLPVGDFTGVSFVPDPGRFKTFSMVPQGSGEWLVTATTTASNALTGFEILGDLQFTGVADKSKFATLNGNSVSAIKAAGSTMGSTGTWPGRAVLIAAEPLFEVEQTATLELNLILYGIASTEYEIQESPELMEPTWTSNNTVTTGSDMTTSWDSISATSNTLYFRAVEK